MGWASLPQSHFVADKRNPRFAGRMPAEVAREDGRDRVLYELRNLITVIDRAIEQHSGFCFRLPVTLACLRIKSGRMYQHDGLGPERDGPLKFAEAPPFVLWQINVRAFPLNQRKVIRPAIAVGLVPCARVAKVAWGTGCSSNFSLILVF